MKLARFGLKLSGADTASRIGKFLAILALAGGAVAPVHAKDAYPTKPITLIVPFPPGGAADSVGRILGQKLSESMGQSIIVENRAGASGIIGSRIVAHAASDGYTLLITLGPPHQTVQLFNKNIGYDPIKNFTPIDIIATAPQAIVVPTSSPIKTFSDYIAAAKANPNGLTYGTSGVATSQHLGGMMIADATKAKLIHIGYRGAAPAITDVVGTHIDSAISVLSNTLPFIKEGKLRALAVLEAHRSKTAPSIPTIAEAGLPGVSVPDTWVGILGPAKLPPYIVERLHREISKALADDGVKGKLAKIGYEVADIAPEEFSKRLVSSVEIYQRLVKAAGIEPE